MAIQPCLKGASILAAMCMAVPALAAAPMERSVVLTQGHPSGFQEVRQEAGGIVAHFEFNDRGRGPKMDVQYRLAADGTLQRVDAGGVNYLKAAVDEHFLLQKGQASWRSAGENEKRAVAAPAFYQSIDSTPEEFTLLVQALLKAPGQRLPLLPAGEAQLRKVSDETVAGKGGSAQVSLYAVTGIDLTPDYLWLDDKGRFFASYSDWMTLVREGWEDVVPALGKLQNAQDQKLAAARATALTRQLDKPLAIEHVRVFDPDALAAKAGQTVVVRDGHVAAVGDDGTLKLPEQTERLDGQGRFLMSGLWDMHTHLAANDGPLDIAAGITTIRDLGNDPDVLAGLIEAAEAGRDIGPRVIKAGLIDGHGPFQSPIKIFADTPEEAVKQVDYYADQGYVQIKIYSSVKPELVPVIVKEARARGLRISGHVPAFMNAEQFVADGVDEIQHINFLFLNFFFDQVPDTRTPARFTTIAQHGAELDLSSPRVQSFVELLRSHHIVSDPTLVTFEGMFLERPGLMGPSYNRVVDRLPLTYQRSFRAATQGLPVPAGMDARYRESYARMVEMVGLLYRSGVTIVAGTDGFDAFALPREFELYVNAGIPPAEVLRLDTLGAARVMKHDDAYGRVAPGYVSDLILVDGDPLRNIADMRKVRTVLRGDRLYDSAALFQAMGVAPAP
ncbi:MAG: Amidohydrolase family protein [Nevskia sp.]|nr:Amidohydrolase family protein [Nevskia sp.]